MSILTTRGMAEKDAISCSWSGCGDAGLRSNPGRDTIEHREIISRSCAKTEAFFPPEQEIDDAFRVDKDT